MRKSIIVFILPFLLSILGCDSLFTSRIHKMYDGPELQKSQLAFLENDDPTRRRIKSIDGKKIEIKFLREDKIALLPGSHNIVVHIAGLYDSIDFVPLRGHNDISLNFIVETNTNYRLECNLSGRGIGSNWVYHGKVWIEEFKSGNVIASGTIEYET